MMMDTILLTGGTGFVGSFLLEELLKNNKVVLLKRSFSNTQKIDHLLGHKNLIEVNIDQVPIEESFKDNQIDVIIHAATNYGRKGELPSEIVEPALLLPLQLLQLGMTYGVGTFINTDSYFNRTIELPDVLGYHADTKRLFLSFAKNMIKTGDIQFLNFEMGHVYGPKDDLRKLVPLVILKLLRNEEKIDLVVGKNERNFIYIKDLVAAYLTMVDNRQKMQKYENFNGRTGEYVTVRQMAELVKLYSKSSTHLNFGAYPDRPNEIWTIPREEEPLRNYGRKPEYDIHTGLKETIEYYRGIISPSDGKK